MWAWRQPALMATTDTTLTLARLTATTGLIGLWVAYSSGLVLGTAGDTVGAAAGGAATTAVAATAGVDTAITDARDMADEGTVDTVMLDEVTPDGATRVVDSEVTRSTAAEVVSTVEQLAGSMAAVADSTVVAVATAAADIDNRL